jgi:hypothetical protein
LAARSREEFRPLGSEPVVDFRQKALRVNAKLAGLRRGHTSGEVVHRSVPTDPTVLQVIGNARPAPICQLGKPDEGPAVMLGTMDSIAPERE